MQRQPPPPSSIFQLNVKSIKLPQLVGILAGCLVFVVTIGVVIYLLYASGTLSGAFAELSTKNQSTTPKKKEEEMISPYSNQPELFDNLISARCSLPKRLAIPDKEGNVIRIRMLSKADFQNLFEALNGSPQYDESEYDPIRLWGWHELPSVKLDTGNPQELQPWKSLENFQRFIQCEEETEQKSFIVIEEKSYSKPIGMISLTDNSPKNLSINIESVILTPAFQSKKRGHEALFLLLEWLFVNEYRRVTAGCDERHIIYRKFLQRCFFQLETVLRKHKIVSNRNCNTALHIMLNSDWPQIEVNYKSMLKLPLKKDVKAINLIGFSIAPLPDIPKNTSSASESDRHSSDNHSSTQKKKKNRKSKK